MKGRGGQVTRKQSKSMHVDAAGNQLKTGGHGAAIANGAAR